MRAGLVLVGGAAGAAATLWLVARTAAPSPASEVLCPPAGIAPHACADWSAGWASPAPHRLQVLVEDALTGEDARADTTLVETCPARGPLGSRRLQLAGGPQQRPSYSRVVADGHSAAILARTHDGRVGYLELTAAELAQGRLRILHVDRGALVMVLSELDERVDVAELWRGPTLLARVDRGALGRGVEIVPHGPLEVVLHTDTGTHSRRLELALGATALVVFAPSDDAP